MFCDKTMRAHWQRSTNACWERLHIDESGEMLGPIAFSGFERVGSLNAKAAERPIRNIGGKFIQYIKIASHTKFADNALQQACNPFRTYAAGNTFATRFFREIAAALHSPLHHAGIGGQ